MDYLICADCDDGKLPRFADEEKYEETMCAYCQFEMEAECLVDGRPACIDCKMNKKSQMKSPAGSVRSDNKSTISGISSTRHERRDSKVSNYRYPLTTTHEFAQKVERVLAPYKRGDSNVPPESVKANIFLQKYTSDRFQDLVHLYNTHNDGYSGSSFHGKVDNKGGIIIIILLASGYEIGAYSWKGIKKGKHEENDVQSGGVIIKNGAYEFVSFPDQYVINEPEGVRFSRSSSLYLNFDDLEESVCNFDKNLAGNEAWTRLIREISVYRLQL